MGFSNNKVFFLDDEEDLAMNYQYIKLYPDHCPVCKHGIHAKYFLIHMKNNYLTELLCGCPREECSSLFFVEYTDTNESPFSTEFDYQITRYYPQSFTGKSFSEEINSLSPNFISIYNQALHAENVGLDLICGVGFRKSMEYLIKDYAISITIEDKDKINAMPLQQCIKSYINHSTVKEMSKRAVWLGNDEAHIIRKWKDRDIRDLKKLIDIVVHYITMEIMATEYKKEMNIE